MGASGTDTTQGRNLARGHQRKKEPTGKARTAQKVGRTKAVRGTVSVVYEMLLAIGHSTGGQTLGQNVEVAKNKTNKKKNRPVDHFQKHIPRGTRQCRTGCWGMGKEPRRGAAVPRGLL